jgi:hypothetical protein
LSLGQGGKNQGDERQENRLNSHNCGAFSGAISVDGSRSVRPSDREAEEGEEQDKKSEM